jgi:hypothetical protein
MTALITRSDYFFSTLALIESTTGQAVRLVMLACEDAHDEGADAAATASIQLAYEQGAPVVIEGASNCR